MNTYVGRVVTAISLLIPTLYLAACNFMNTPAPTQVREPTKQVLVDPTYTPTIREATATPTLEEMATTPIPTLNPSATPTPNLSGYSIKIGSTVCDFQPNIAQDGTFYLMTTCPEDIGMAIGSTTWMRFYFNGPDGNIVPLSPVNNLSDLVSRLGLTGIIGEYVHDVRDLGYLGCKVTQGNEGNDVYCGFRYAGENFLVRGTAVELGTGDTQSGNDEGNGGGPRPTNPPPTDDPDT